MRSSPAPACPVVPACTPCPPVQAEAAKGRSEMSKRLLSKLSTGCLCIGLAACGGGGDAGGGGGGGGGGGPATTLQAEIDQLFPFTPNQPFDVTMICGRVNSQLTYYFDFDANGTFGVYIRLDNGQEVSFGGTYAYANWAIRMVALNNPILPLDETTTRIVPHMGMVGEIETPGMRCGAIGHGYNPPATESYRSYDCPLINIGAASDEDNSIEFVHGVLPTNIVVPGGIFRQRDINVYGTTNPNVTRGQGIYRRVGDTFYADFGSGQFPDFNLLKGRFVAADQQLSVEQLDPASGTCRRR
jgi:hypothetical protein